MKEYKTYFNWSTGKDSALALYNLLQDADYNVECLLTSVNAFHNRVSMHGLRRELLLQQTQSIGLPCVTIELPEQPTNIEYENNMRQTVTQLKQHGCTHSAFGDIFLEDLKKYREQQLKAIGIQAVFPLWRRDTKQLINEFIELGFKAIVICVNASLLDASFAGRTIDMDFINDLQEGIDPCGENGEFHTFCFDGPIFKHPVEFTVGDVIYREYESGTLKHGYWFCDILPSKDTTS